MTDPLPRSELSAAISLNLRYHARKVLHTDVAQPLYVSRADETLGAPVVVSGVHWYPVLHPGITLRDWRDVQWHAVFGYLARDRDQFVLTYDSGRACDPGWYLTVHPSSSGPPMFPAWQAARRQDAMSRFARHETRHLNRS